MSPNLKQDAARRKLEFELAARLSTGVVNQPILKARLRQLDGLDARFRARHPVMFILGYLSMVGLGIFNFWFLTWAGQIEDRAWWSFAGLGFMFCTVGLSQLLLLGVLRNPHRRERVLIDALLHSQQPDPFAE